MPQKLIIAAILLMWAISICGAIVAQETSETPTDNDAGKAVLIPLGLTVLGIVIIFLI